MQVVPALPKPVESAALSSQTEAEARRDMEASTGFSGRVQDWWQEYRRDALAPPAEGVMRLTASGEDGRQRPCCAFVRPLQLGRSATLNAQIMLMQVLTKGIWEPRTLDSSLCRRQSESAATTLQQSLLPTPNETLCILACLSAPAHALELQLIEV